MNTIDSLFLLKEQLSEENFQEIVQIMEGLFVNDGRGDLFDDVSKLLTGKPLTHHIRKGTTKAVKYLASQVKQAMKNKKKQQITK